MKYLVFIILFILSNTSLLAQQENDVFIIAGLLYDSEQNVLLENRVIHVSGNTILNIGEESIIPA